MFLSPEIGKRLIDVPVSCLDGRNERLQLFLAGATIVSPIEIFCNRLQFRENAMYFLFLWQ